VRDIRWLNSPFDLDKLNELCKKHQLKLQAPARLAGTLPETATMLN